MQPASDSCLSLLKGPNCPLHLTSSDCHLTRFPRKIRHGNLPPFRNDLGINRSEVSTDAFLKSLPCRPPIPPSGACHLVQSACLTSLCWLDTRGPHAKASFEPQAFSILRSTHPWLLSWIGSCVFFQTFSSLPPSFLPPSSHPALLEDASFWPLPRLWIYPFNHTDSWALGSGTSLLQARSLSWTSKAG